MASCRRGGHTATRASSSSNQGERTHRLVASERPETACRGGITSGGARSRAACG
jgi:hypothetical protein